MSDEPPEPPQWVMNMTLRQILDLFRRYSLGETPPVHPGLQNTIGMRHPLHPEGPGPDESYPDLQASQALPHTSPDRSWRPEESGPAMPPWSPPEGGITEGETLGIPTMEPWRAAPPWERPYSPTPSDVPYTPDSSLGVISEMEDSLTRRLNLSGQSSLGLLSPGGMPSPLQSPGRSSAGPSKHASPCTPYDRSFRTSPSSRQHSPYQSSEQSSLGILSSSKSPSPGPPTHSYLGGSPSDRPTSPYQSDQSSLGVMSRMDDSFSSHRQRSPGRSTPCSSRTGSPYPLSDHSSLGLLPRADDTYSSQRHTTDESFGDSSYIQVSLTAHVSSSTRIPGLSSDRSPLGKSPSKRDKSPCQSDQPAKGFSSSVRHKSHSPPSDQSPVRKSPSKKQTRSSPHQSSAETSLPSSSREGSPCQPSDKASPIPVSSPSRQQSPCPPGQSQVGMSPSSRQESPCPPGQSHVGKPTSSRHESPCPPSGQSSVRTSPSSQQESPCPPSGQSYVAGSPSSRHESPCPHSSQSYVGMSPSSRQESPCPPFGQSYVAGSPSSRHASPCPPSGQSYVAGSPSSIHGSPCPPSGQSYDAGSPSSRYESPCPPSGQSYVGGSPSSRHKSPCCPHSSQPHVGMSHSSRQGNQFSTSDKSPAGGAYYSNQGSNFSPSDQGSRVESTSRTHKSPCSSSDKSPKRRHKSPSPPSSQRSPGAPDLMSRMGDSFPREHTGETMGILYKLEDSLSLVENLMEDIKSWSTNWTLLKGIPASTRIPLASGRMMSPRPASSQSSQLDVIKNAVNHVLQQVPRSPTTPQQDYSIPSQFFQTPPSYHQSPRVQSPRVQSPRVQSPRVQSPRVQSPRAQSPKGLSGDEWLLEDAQLKEEQTQLEQDLQAHRNEWSPQDCTTHPPWGQQGVAPLGGVTPGDTMGGILDRPIVATPPWDRYPRHESPESPDSDRYRKHLSNKSFRPPRSPPTPASPMPRKRESAPTTQMDEEFRYNYYWKTQKTVQLPTGGFHQRSKSASRSEQPSPYPGSPAMRGSRPKSAPEQPMRPPPPSPLPADVEWYKPAGRPLQDQIRNQGREMAYDAHRQTSRIPQSKGQRKNWPTVPGTPPAVPYSYPLRFKRQTPVETSPSHSSVGRCPEPGPSRSQQTFDDSNRSTPQAAHREFTHSQPSPASPVRSVRFSRHLEQTRIIPLRSTPSSEQHERRIPTPRRYYNRPPQPDPYPDMTDEQKLMRFGTVGPWYPRTASTYHPPCEEPTPERPRSPAREEWSSSPIPAAESRTRLRFIPPPRFRHPTTSTPTGRFDRAAQEAIASDRSRSSSRGRGHSRINDQSGDSQPDPTRSERCALEPELHFERSLLDTDKRIRKIEADLIDDTKADAAQFLYPYMSPDAKEGFMRSLGKINCALTRLKGIIKRRSESSFATHSFNHDLQGGQSGCPTSATI